MVERNSQASPAGLATYRLVRYADDSVVLVSGTRAHAEALREETAAGQLLPGTGPRRQTSTICAGSHS